MDVMRDLERLVWGVFIIALALLVWEMMRP
jgi:hypothetical protein